MKQIIYIISIICSLLIFNNYALAVDEDYPEVEPRKKYEEMGSIVGGEGLVFRPGRVKNESTKSQASTINKYMWQASIETLNFAPLASADSNGGVIITEWYSPKGNIKYRFKINIFLKDNIISPDSIQVKVFEQTLKNGNWIDNYNSPNLAISIEDKILRKARELYISEKIKE
jgi:hypothetical protein